MDQKTTGVCFCLLFLLSLYARGETAENCYSRALQHAQSGQQDSAEQCLDRALSMVLKTGEKKTWVKYVHEFGKVYRKTDPAAALAHYKNYLVVARLHFGDRDTIAAELCARIGDIYRNPPFSRYFESLQYFEEALQIFGEHGMENTFTGFIHHFAGTTYTRTGSYETAQSHLLRAIHIRLREKDTLHAAQSYNNLGIVFADLMDHDKAIDYYDRALDLVGSKSGEKYEVQKAELLLNKAECLLSLETPEKARALLSEALAAFEKYNDPEGKSAACHTLGKLFEQRKEWTKAQDHYQRALDLAKTAYGEKHREVAKIHADIGDLHLERGQRDDALRYYQNALQCLIPVDPSGPRLQNPAPGDLYPEPWIMIALHRKAHIHFMNFREGSHIVDLYKALEAIELAVMEMDMLRDSYAYDKDKQWLFSSYHAVLSLARAISLQLKETTRNTWYDQQAFSYLEKSKACTLLELLKEVEAKKRSGVPDSLVTRGRRLRAEIERLHTAASGHQPAAKEAELQLAEARQAFEQLSRHLEVHYPAYYRIKYADTPRSITDIQAGLPDLQSAVLEYAVDDTLLHLFVILKNTYHVFSAPADTAFFDMLKIFSQAAGSPDFITDPEAAYRKFTHSGFHLYELLVKPALDFCQQSGNKVNTLIIIPDAVFGHLPFEALISTLPASREADYRHLPYLVRDYTIHYAYSSSTLGYQRQKGPGKKPKGFIAFAPTFGHLNGLAALKHTEEEIRGISALVGGNCYSGYLATKSRFMEEAPGHSIIHLATHTLMDDERPLHSHLFFTPDHINNDSGMFYAYELFGLELNTELAVLSACNTGNGKLVKGEGILSLAWGFAYAGCPSVLMSLWQVNDRSTSVIMQGFYNELVSGRSKDSALRMAKLKYLEGADALEGHPFFWAGFVLQGDASPVSITNAPPHAALIGLFICCPLFLLTWMGIRIKRKRTTVSELV